MNVRLFTVDRVRAGHAAGTTAFRHVHDLSVLTQNTERRGALVSRVTSDVDTISTFMQWGGLMLVISVGPAAGRHRADGVLLLAAHAAGLGLLPAAVRRCCRASSGWSRAPTRGSASGSATCSARSARRWSARAVDPGVRRRGPHRASASTPRSRRTAGRADPGAEDRRAHVFPLTEIVAGGRRLPGSCCSACCSASAATSRVGRAGRVPVPDHAVRRPGAGRHRGAQRGAERGRRLAAGARRARHPGRRRRPRPGRRRAAARPDRRALRGRRRSPTPAAPPVLHEVGGARSRRAPGSRWSARPARARPPSPSCSPG